jgi:hypothetical protein
MLPDETAATLSFLRTLPDGAVCEACLATYLGVSAARNVSRGVRALIQARRILCLFTACSICEKVAFVARADAPQALGA